MRKTSLLFVLLAMLSLAGQAKMDPFDLHVASLRVLEQRDVQHEIGITPAQRAKMDKFAESYNTELTAYQAQRKKENKEPVLDETVADMLDKVKQNVMTVLTPAQLRRLREISLQAFGLNGILDPTVGRKVGLSNDQMARMKKTYEDGSKKANDIMSKAMQPVNEHFKTKPKSQQEAQAMQSSYLAMSKQAMKAIMPQVQKVNDETQSSMLAIFTPKQKKAYLALQGKPFRSKASGSGAH